MFEKRWMNERYENSLSRRTSVSPVRALPVSMDVTPDVIGIAEGAPSTARMPARRSWSTVPAIPSRFASLNAPKIGSVTIAIASAPLAPSAVRPLNAKGCPNARA
jgi:hypothetical protein